MIATLCLISAISYSTGDKTIINGGILHIKNEPSELAKALIKACK